MSKPKFKVGDRVRVKPSSLAEWGHLYKGTLTIEKHPHSTDGDAIIVYRNDRSRGMSMVIPDVMELVVVKNKIGGEILC